MTRKLRLVLRFMTSQTGNQIIAIHILPSISRSKANETLKFGQLISFLKGFLLPENASDLRVGL